MDAFFVAVERLRDPSLVGRPVVVGGAGPRSVVAAASYEVRGFGIRSAMPMTRARRLCPDLVVVPPDHAEYGRVSEVVFGIFRSITPLVEGLSIDEAFLDVSGLRLHHASSVEVGRLVRERIRSDVGITASVGVAASKFVAKLASEASKPDGLRHVALDRQQEFLDALGARSLWGVGEATMASLEGIGVATVADLRSVPSRVLERAVGSTVAAHLVALSVGRDPRPVEPDRAAKSVSVEETFDRDIATEAAIVGEISRLADRLGSRLRRAGLAGRTVTLKVRTSDFETMTRSRTLADPVDSDRVIRSVAGELLDHEAIAGRPVRLVGIGVSLLTDAGEPTQLAVLDDARWGEVERTVDAIRDRFGDGALGPGRRERS